VKTIAMLPVRNEAWVLEHALACLSAFCDVVIVSDQGSTDGSRDICRRYPKVVVLEAPSQSDADKLPLRARWRLLDAARGYDGNNLLWCTDADELVSPRLARAFIDASAVQMTPARAISLRYIHLWKSLSRYRDDWSQYGPTWKVMAWRDDRRMDFARDPDRRPLHEPRTPVDEDPRPLQAPDVPVLHLQFAMWQRNQMKQAWYRALEWMDGRRTAGDINGQYAITFEPLFVRTSPLPADWLDGVTIPGESVSGQPTWHDAEMLRLFDEKGVEFFEPLEIWHLPLLRREFRRRTGRQPRPDRSHIAPLPARLSRFGGRILRAVKRRIAP
jgi:hypothetical protein